MNEDLFNKDKENGTQQTHSADIFAEERDVIKSQYIGSKSVRIRKVRHKGITKLEHGAYEIAAIEKPTSFFGKIFDKIHIFLFGVPLKSKEEIHERLTKVKGLAVFASDNISSSAYATEEIMKVLIYAGAGALALTMPITITVVILLAIVTFSYQQTIRAYPNGGGSYIVAKDNLGDMSGLVAASSLLIDYVLTVAVSVAAGIAAVTSAFPVLHDEKVLLCIIAIAMITLANLRGIRESGTIFTLPAYYYIFSMFGFLAYGIFKYMTTGLPHAAPPPTMAEHGPIAVLSVFLILRAFSSGCVALTGVEAVSNGVPAFKPPESRNARIVLIWMAVIFATIFLGLSFLSHKISIIPDLTETETVISQLVRTIMGKNWYYYVIQSATTILLILAANTSFSDFPRLAYFLARDKFLPSHFSFRGDRLAFNNGIIVLAIIASLLIIIFKASTTKLIPLYMIGVFISFTLSQTGMILRQFRQRAPGWFFGMCVNAMGAISTAVVAVIVGVTKFSQGAWIVLLLIPIMIFIFWDIKVHYEKTANQISIEPEEAKEDIKRAEKQTFDYILIPVADINRPVLKTIEYAKSLLGRGKENVMIQAVHVTTDIEEGYKLQQKWARFNVGIPLVLIESPYRRLVRPILRYIDALEKKHRNAEVIITILVPETVSTAWWKNLYRTNTAFILKGALYFRPRTVVISFPYHM